MDERTYHIRLMHLLNRMELPRTLFDADFEQQHEEGRMRKEILKDRQARLREREPERWADVPPMEIPDDLNVAGFRPRWVTARQKFCHTLARSYSANASQWSNGWWRERVAQNARRRLGLPDEEK